MTARRVIDRVADRVVRELVVGSFLVVVLVSTSECVRRTRAVLAWWR